MKKNYNAPLHPNEPLRLARAGHGYYTYEVDSYKTFIHDIAPLFVRPQRRDTDGKLQQHEYIWRGSRDPQWLLQSSLSRRLERMQLKDLNWQKRASDLTTAHLLNYLSNLRGLNLLKPQHDALHHYLETESKKGYLSFLTVLRKMPLEQQFLTYEVFSLGQHHDLATPFLDWTKVPLIALFFAFKESDSRENGEGHRVLYALNKTIVEQHCPPHEGNAEDSVLFLSSMAHDNPRIIGQAGLFTFNPAHMPVDDWVVKKFRYSEPNPVLLRFLIRNSGRQDCLSELDLLNINPRTIFPDRHGAAAYANSCLETNITTNIS